MNQNSILFEQLCLAARDEGFAWVGVAPAVTADGFSRLADWIDAGYAGEMSYFDSRRNAYEHPESVLAGVRSLVVMALPYDASPFSCDGQTRGKLARYVWQREDYHDVIHTSLKRLGRLILAEYPTSRVRGVVDTAPLLEREFAKLAGIGWIGKNTMLLNPLLGSYFFIACLLTDVEFAVSDPFTTSHCGTCTACLDACPTNAFPQAGVLDATRCISYLTIEHRGPIPLELRSGVGQWLFGCDICQEVCPWNRKPERRDPGRPEALTNLDPRELLLMTDDQFRDRFRKTPLWRAKRRGLARNAAVVLGNLRQVSAVNALSRGLSDSESLVRGASAWALGQIGTSPAIEALQTRREIEADDLVLSEIEFAILNR